MTILELLSDPARWTKGYYARDARGNLQGVHSPAACSWCLLGAAMKCYPTDHDLAVAKLKGMMGYGIPLHSWNDAPGRTHAEVLELVRKAGV